MMLVTYCAVTDFNSPAFWKRSILFLRQFVFFAQWDKAGISQINGYDLLFISFCLPSKRFKTASKLFYHFLFYSQKLVH